MDPQLEELIEVAKLAILRGHGDPAVILKNLAQDAYDSGHADGEEYADNGHG